MENPDIWLATNLTDNAERNIMRNTSYRKDELYIELVQIRQYLKEKISGNLPKKDEMCT